MTSHDPRFEQLSERLDVVQQRIAAAAAANSTVKPTLIVVTKFHPAADVLRLRQLGVGDVGENRDQEAAAKAAQVADPDLRWHFIGQLQKNKAKSVAAYAHSVHSIDRASLVGALGNAMAQQQDATGRKPLACFLQLDLSSVYPALAAPDGDANSGRGGLAPSNMAALADLIADTPGLTLAGLMAVAPLGVSPEPAFELLAQLSAQLVAQHPGATGISAGMSHDLEAAMAAGATHLRVGSDILAPRPVVL
ncbi:YggS family pyridoxal phosphate-dependent enzyme [Arthrobacter glacialis]|uniref:YggS family pyridoxal phosphate-dependent enzyme n=1 Tax=Arthrobacter glacialis TaxID=1664 RepID=UPI000CD41205|nr:YggS family pyridoxal phosphate-dependent enzyme [Arthrobacter glacialis]POH58226.1 YggS family pyridoxal phosphate-dependent enzyme [Arthrobacter glacialis]